MVQAIACVSCSQEPKERPGGCTRMHTKGCLPKEAEWRSSPFAYGSFSFLCRAQEATELLSEDLLQVRCGLGWQACVCLCLGVGTCPAPAAICPASTSKSWGWDLPTCQRVISGPWCQGIGRLLLPARAFPAAHRGMNPDQELCSLFTGPDAPSCGRMLGRCRGLTLPKCHVPTKVVHSSSLPCHSWAEKNLMKAS